MLRHQKGKPKGGRNRDFSAVPPPDEVIPKWQNRERAASEAIPKWVKRERATSSKGYAKGDSSAVPDLFQIHTEENLSEETKAFHKGLVDLVPSEFVDRGTWNTEFFNRLELEGLDGPIFFEHIHPPKGPRQNQEHADLHWTRPRREQR